jgi:eukaryotic-like serine/threonine-protein kinase
MASADLRERVRAALRTDYEIDRELGQGGMATVFRARDVKHGRPVAVKVLRSELSAGLAAQRFLREIEIAARLSHPHILPLHDSGDADGVLFYVMPYVEGESLRQRLARERQLPVRDAVLVAGQVADALDYAHRRGVVHRDVKPENILLEEGHAVVADFGIARAVSEAAAGDRTRTGVAVGTPAYMSPEQASGEREVDGRSDVYSLGCVLYEMLAGEPPFTGPTAQAALARRFTEAPPSVELARPAVPAGVAAIVAKALATLPSDRFQSAAQLAQALSAETAKLDAPSAPQSPITGRRSSFARPRARRRPAWIAAGAGAAAAALALGVLRYAPRRAPAPVATASDPVAMAVLPFHALALPEGSEFLTVGIPDAIITRIAGVRQMRVRPTSAVLPYQSDTVDVRRAGERLGVEYVLLGTIESAGERLRVSVQMVRAHDAVPLWGEHYDVARTDLLSLQDSIAERVTASLRIRMSAAERALVYRRYTQDATAYELYLGGRAQLARHTEASTRAAIAAFDAAMARDPGYALAEAGLAMASAEMHLRFAPEASREQWATNAMRQARGALAADSLLAETHLAMAAVYRNTEFDWPKTIAESRRALELNPSLALPHYLMAAAYYHLGLLELVDREARAGIAADPTGDRVEFLRTRGIAALFGGRFAEAQALLEEVQRISSRPLSDPYLAHVYYYTGETARAERMFEQLRGPRSGVTAARAQAALAGILAARGDRARAHALLEEIPPALRRDHHVAYSTGATYAQLGDLPAARLWLARAVEAGFPCYPWFARDPLLGPVRHDTAFARFLEELRGTWEAAEKLYGTQPD